MSAAEPIDFRRRTADQRAFLDRCGARALSDIPRTAPDPLLYGSLDPAGHTILYGTGGVGKGVRACDWVVRLTEDGHHVLIVDYEDHPEEWSRRVHSLGGATEQVTHVAPLAETWKEKRGAIWDQQVELRAIAGVVGATYAVVDSLIPACGATDVMKPEAASQYGAALTYIGLPVLSLGHVNRAEDGRYPFGSIFWHNLCRVSWSMAKVTDGALLTNRKANNYEPQGRRLVTVTWRDGLPGEVADRSYAAKLAELIETVLTEPMTVAEVVAALNDDRGEDDPPYKPDSISKALKRGITSIPKRFTVEGSGASAKWVKA